MSECKYTIDRLYSRLQNQLPLFAIEKFSVYGPLLQPSHTLYPTPSPVSSKTSCLEEICRQLAMAPLRPSSFSLLRDP